MKQFQPVGFGQKVMETYLGVMAYYTPVGAPWRSQDDNTHRPTLIFLHSLGGGSSAYEWSKVYPAFATEYDVIAPDLVGWGQSAHPPRDYRSEDYLAVITELLEYHADHPTTVCATSLTAGLCLRLATQRPDLFKSLFVVSPSGYNDFGVDYQATLSAQLTRIPGLDRVIYALGAANEVAIANFMQQFLFAQCDRITPEMVKAYLTSATQPNAEYAALASLKGSICFDLSRYLTHLRVPTMMIWGERSRFQSPEVGQRLAKLNPQEIQRFEVIPDAGVLPHLEVPAVVIGLLRQWLNRSEE
ncbi:MAG: alpha/beta hydrolase [Synechococcales cyanobacterium T60_A2020_003]|nr:alpha/beta hydrolase [Synechococcales cyanobacterium T60_A2020_003]